MTTPTPEPISDALSSLPTHRRDFGDTTTD